MTIVIWKLKEWKTQTLKNDIFDSPLIINQTFSQTEYVIGKSDFIYIMHFQQTKYLIFLDFVVGEPKKLQALTRYFFWWRLSKDCIVEFNAVFVCLLLSWTRRYTMEWSINFDRRNFNNIWLRYFHFSNMTNLCENICFIKNSKCPQFLF